MKIFPAIFTYFSTFQIWNPTQAKPCSRFGPKRHIFIGPNIPIDDQLKLADIKNLPAYIKAVDQIVNEGSQPFDVCNSCEEIDQPNSWQHTDKCFKEVAGENGSFVRCEGGLGFKFPCPKELIWDHAIFVCSNRLSGFVPSFGPPQGLTKNDDADFQKLKTTT